MAFSREEGSRRSPVAVSHCKPSRFFRLLVGRTSSRKSAPCSARARATWEPRNPVAPVRKMSIWRAFSTQHSAQSRFDMVLNLLKLALQRGVFGDYPGNIFQYLDARLRVHHSLQVIVANACGKSHVVWCLGLVVDWLGVFQCAV